MVCEPDKREIILYNDSTISFALQNGTYDYQIGIESTYSASPSGGSFTVNGSPVSLAITFRSGTLHFITGMINPSNASLYINGKLETTTNGYFNISLPDGTYTILVTYNGYTSYTKTITIVVELRRVTSLTISLSRSNESSFQWLIAVVVVVIVVVLLVLIMAIRGRRGMPTPLPPPPPPM